MCVWGEGKGGRNGGGGVVVVVVLMVCIDDVCIHATKRHTPNSGGATFVWT